MKRVSFREVVICNDKEKMPKGVDNWMEVCSLREECYQNRSIYIYSDPQRFTEQELWESVFRQNK